MASNFEWVKRLTAKERKLINEGMEAGELDAGCRPFPLSPDELEAVAVKGNGRGER